MPGVTAEQVQAAAEAIAAEGQRPNVRSIRDRLGTGSFNTIQRYLLDWRETRPTITQAEYGVSPELANVIGKEYRRGAEAATSEIRVELASCREELRESTMNAEELERGIKELTAEVELLTHERDTAAAEAAARADEIQRLTDQVRREQDAAEAARTEVATARVKIETQAEQIAEVKSQWGEQVASLKGEIADYHQKLDIARDNAQQAQQSAAVAESEVKSETRRADQAEQREASATERLQREIVELKEELSGARKEAKEAHQATAKEADKWSETVALEHKRNAELQSERDSLAEQVAKLEQGEKTTNPQ